MRDGRFLFIGGPFELADEGLRRVLHVANELSRLASDLGELIGAEEEQGDYPGDGHVGYGEHAEGFFPGSCNGTRPGSGVA
jgi:hypothetical protein